MGKTQRRPGPAPSVGKVAYRVCGPKGEVDVARAEPSHALVRAQTIALQRENVKELRVIADYVLGPARSLYRVVRTEDGTVFTHVISEED